MTFLTTGMTDSQHLTSPSFLSHTGNGLHVSAGPTIILVVIHSRAGTGNRPECCGVIKGLSLASVNSLTLCWRRAYAELVGLRRREEMGGWEGKPGSWRKTVWLSIPVRADSWPVTVSLPRYWLEGDFDNVFKESSYYLIRCCYLRLNSKNKNKLNG